MRNTFLLAVVVASLCLQGVAEGLKTSQLNGTAFLHLSHVHRGGGWNERPDNTLETFLWCWGHGTAVECDCRRTKDGVGIMLHDKTLKRNARGISKELSECDVSQELNWSDVRDVDVGSYLNAAYSSYRIPTIDAVFAAMKGHPSYLCFVDEKGAGPEFIAERAKMYGVESQVYYTGPSQSEAEKWKRVMPEGKTLLWMGAWPKNHGPEERKRADRYFRSQMKVLRNKGFASISAVSIHSYYDPSDRTDPFIPSQAVLVEMLKEFHDHGIPVVSMPFQGGHLKEVYFKLFDMGFDGFSTDHPSVMFDVVNRLKENYCEVSK